MSSDNTDRLMNDLALAIARWVPRRTYVPPVPPDIAAEAQRIREQLLLERQWRQAQLAMLGLAD